MRLTLVLLFVSYLGVRQINSNLIYQGYEIFYSGIGTFGTAVNNCSSRLMALADSRHTVMAENIPDEIRQAIILIGGWSPLRDILVWLNVSDQITEGVWINGDGNPVIQSNFIAARPDTSPGNENDCIQANVDNHMLWTDVDCTAQANIICLRPVPATTSETTTTTSQLTTTTSQLTTTTSQLTTTTSQLTTTTSQMTTTTQATVGTTVRIQPTSSSTSSHAITPSMAGIAEPQTFSSYAGFQLTPPVNANCMAYGELCSKSASSISTRTNEYLLMDFCFMDCIRKGINCIGMAKLSSNDFILLTKVAMKNPPGGRVQCWLKLE